MTDAAFQVVVGYDGAGAIRAVLTAAPDHIEANKAHAPPGLSWLVNDPADPTPGFSTHRVEAGAIVPIP